MNWSDEVLREATRKIVFEKQTYPRVAAELTAELGMGYIHPEQLRGAVRRYAARMMRQEAPLEPEIHVERQADPAVVRPIYRPNRPIPIRVPVRHVAFGAIGDTHLASNYERLDVIESLYDVFVNRGVTDVYHTGNYIDGEAAFNVNEIKAHGIDGQSRYFLQNYPYRRGISTYFIDGSDHEGWYTQRHGIVMGQHIEDMAHRSGRDDLVYIGYMEADVAVAQGSRRTIRVCHPGGGSSYALSHTGQKIIDSYEDYEKPDILLIGHYHKASYLPNYRGVAIIQTGCAQEPTPFMRKKRLHADLGGWVVTVGLSAEDEITHVLTEFIAYEQNPWKHRIEY